MPIASSGPQFTAKKNLTINVFCLTFCQEHRACSLCELFDRASHIQVTTNSLRKRIRALQIRSFQYSHQGSDQQTPKSFCSPDLIHHVLAGACKPAALALCCPLSDWVFEFGIAHPDHCRVSIKEKQWVNQPCVWHKTFVSFYIRVWSEQPNGQVQERHSNGWWWW